MRWHNRRLGRRELLRAAIPPFNSADDTALAISKQQAHDTAFHTALNVEFVEGSVIKIYRTLPDSDFALANP